MRGSLRFEVLLSAWLFSLTGGCSGDPSGQAVTADLATGGVGTGGVGTGGVGENAGSGGSADPTAGNGPVSAGGTLNGDGGTGGAGASPTTAGEAGTAGVGGMMNAGGAQPEGGAAVGGSGGVSVAGGPAQAIGGAPNEHAFDVRLDTRYDSAAWFDEQRVQLVQAAAARWTRFIDADFGTVPAETNLRARHPEEMLGDGMYLQLEYDIDDLVVLLGSDGAYDGTARLGRTGLSFTTQDVEPTLAALLVLRYEGSPAQPWLATMTFDPTYDWYFDTTPEDSSDIPAEQTDFLSVATHEMGHALGLGNLQAFKDFLVDDTFVGPRAMEMYGGPVPMSDTGHIAADLMFEGELPAMELGTAPGQRKNVTKLDLAMLEDIGYTIRWEEL